jgi:hypothetical protein
MDLYLEAPGGWLSFRNRLIGALDEVLSASLGPALFVAQQTAVYLIEPDDPRHQPPLVPDVFVAEAPLLLMVAAGQAITPPRLVWLAERVMQWPAEQSENGTRPTPLTE